MKESEAPKYTAQVTPLPEEDGGGFEASYVELQRSLTAYDATDIGALEKLGEMLPDYIRFLKEKGVALPPAASGASESSGKFVVRVPKSLHASLVRLAEREGVSLNSLIQVALAEFVGASTSPRAKSA